MLLNWLSSFLPPLKIIVTSLWTPWALLIVIAIGWVLSHIKPANKPEDKPSKIAKLKATFSAQKIPNLIFFGAALLWSTLLLILLIGLCGFIFDIIASPLSEEKEPSFRFLVTKTAALTAILGAVVALPFTVIRLKLTTEQNKHNENVLYNDKLHQASTDLHAQRQVSKSTKGKNSDRQYVTVWEDDIIRRNGAIDRLESLAVERPETAPDIARILCIYLKEMTREYPAEKMPDDITGDDIRNWAKNLTVKRSDMEVAAQVLGRLPDIRGVDVQNLQIDLTKVNLQAMNLKRLNFEGVTMPQVNLDGAELNWTKLNGAELKEANLNGADLQFSELIQASFFNAKLLGSTLRHATLIKTMLAYADLSYVDCNTTHFHEVNMHCARFIESQLKYCKFKYLGLHGNINFTEANTAYLALRHTDLRQLCNPENLLKCSFGDKSNILPDDMKHLVKNKWPSTVLNDQSFHQEWQLFINNPDAYVPPQLRGKN